MRYLATNLSDVLLRLLNPCFLLWFLSTMASAMEEEDIVTGSSCASTGGGGGRRVEGFVLQLFFGITYLSMGCL